MGMNVKVWADVAVDWPEVWADVAVDWPDVWADVAVDWPEVWAGVAVAVAEELSVGEWKCGCWCLTLPLLSTDGH